MYKFKKLMESKLRRLNEGAVKDDAYKQFESGMKYAIQFEDERTEYFVDKPIIIDLSKLFGDEDLEECGEKILKESDLDDKNLLGLEKLHKDLELEDSEELEEDLDPKVEEEAKKKD
jgi:hypothetical protein